MVADQQTHSLPTDAAALDSVARLDGLPDGKALVDELATISEAVGTRFDALIRIYAPTGAVAVEARPLVGELEQLGFADAEALATRIEGWEGGQFRALRGAEARNAYARLRPQLLRALAEAPIRNARCCAGNSCWAACHRRSTCSACSKRGPACWSWSCASWPMRRRWPTNSHGAATCSIR
jgi:glutamine synthetase adenylyltransferase